MTSIWRTAVSKGSRSELLICSRSELLICSELSVA